MQAREPVRVDKLGLLFADCLCLVVEMASVPATEPCPVAESIVPACMFAPDQGCGDDPTGGDGFEDGEGTYGESEDHLNLSSKVGLTKNYT